MENQITRYPVQNSLLKKYIRFFWVLRMDHSQLNHKIIPQKNINLRFNLSDVPHSVSLNGKEKRLEDVYFLGFQEEFRNVFLQINGKVDVLGICFHPDGFFPFLQVPLVEFKNQLLGADEIGFKIGLEINDWMRETKDVNVRLQLLEEHLFSLLLKNRTYGKDNFRPLFMELIQHKDSISISDFCRQSNVSKRTLERSFNKYIGISVSSYHTLCRFHESFNQMLKYDFSKLSDLAYDNGYFDQTHFIRDFKRFAGDTPGNYLEKKDSILQIGKML